MLRNAIISTAIQAAIQLGEYMKTQLVTGGAGFIGSAYVLQARARGARVINLDKLTYSGNTKNLISLANDPEHIFIHGDIGNRELVRHLLRTYQPDAIVNFAAESHVDRSILDPDIFIKTNVLGTGVLLKQSLEFYQSLPSDKQKKFKLLHVSTDEVYGSLNEKEDAFTEENAYRPNSPYSASKASSDHLVRAFHETYGLPTLITNCSNNYGPRQFPEKLIPVIILKALQRESLPVYGNGENIRDWLHVEDHCEAIACVLEKGAPGETYNIGGRAEYRNIDVVKSICAILNELVPHSDGPYEKLITYVNDRLGHDYRYAINCTKIESQLGWKPRHTFIQGLRETIQWYLKNSAWINDVQSGYYLEYQQQNYHDRGEK
jgi:dTDP-glucose 4,6-dehydratase